MGRACHKCGTEFEPTPAQCRKWDWRCAICTSVANQKARAKRQEEPKAHSAKKYRNPEYKAVIAAYRKRPEVRDRRAANDQVRHEIRMGRMQRLPCEVCGDPSAQAHHDNYQLPLDVRWLCATHHYAHHAKLRELSRQKFAAPINTVEAK